MNVRLQVSNDIFSRLLRIKTKIHKRTEEEGKFKSTQSIAFRITQFQIFIIPNNLFETLSHIGDIFSRLENVFKKENELLRKKGNKERFVIYIFVIVDFVLQF